MTHPPPNPTRQRLIAWGFVAIQALLLLGLVLAPRGTQWPVTPAVQIVGWTAIASGIALGLWSARYLGRGLTPSPLPNGAVDLVTAGPYRYVRHPMYTAVMLLAAGVAVRSGSWIVVGVTVALVGLFSVKSRWEEQRLTASFPGYAAYRQSVPRFVPARKRMAT
jgi:protein-S-isoprenylcysteine O-methyltransferase Ste14